MFGFLKKLFGGKAESTQPTDNRPFVFVHLNAKAMPLERGKRFEDPLDQALRDEKLGEVGGAGTGLDAHGGISFIGLDVWVEDLERAVPFLVETLNGLGAPKGSRLEFEKEGEQQQVPFGDLEAIAVVLKTSEVARDPEEAQRVVAELRRAAFVTGELLDILEGENETSLNFYGPSAEAMRSAIQPALTTHRLCQSARVEQFA